METKDCAGPKLAVRKGFGAPGFPHPQLLLRVQSCPACLRSALWLGSHFPPAGGALSLGLLWGLFGIWPGLTVCVALGTHCIPHTRLEGEGGGSGCGWEDMGFQ